MTLFQNRPLTQERLLDFPAFRSLDAYLSSDKPVSAIEEQDFSTFAFLQSDLTFLTFDGQVNSHSLVTMLAPRHFTLFCDEPFDPTGPLPIIESGRQDTIDPDALPLVEGPVKLGLGVTRESVWMPLAKVVSYVPLRPTGEGKDKKLRRFLRRSFPRGETIERVKDWARWETEGPQRRVYEGGLYMHLQMEKEQRE